MANKITCTCGHSWDKSDSSKKDATVCHICGKNNAMKMQNGGWLDKYGEEINANEGHSSAPKEWIGEGYSTEGRNYSPAWGGQFQKGGYLPQAQRGTFVQPTRADSLELYNNAVAIRKYYDDLTRKGWYNKPEVSQLPPSIKKSEYKDWMEKVKSESLETYRRILRSNEYNNLSEFKYFKNLNPNATFKDFQKAIAKSLGQTKTGSGDRYYYKDLFPSVIDPLAPSTLVNLNILPNESIRYEMIGDRNSTADTPSGGSVTGLYGYNPLSVKPADMRSTEEQKEWEKRYGKPKPPTKTQTEKSNPSKGMQIQERKFPKLDIPNVEMSGPYMVGYQDWETGQGIDRGFATAEERDAFYKQLGERDAKANVNLNSNISSYYDVKKKKKQNGGQFQMGGNVYPVNYIPKAQKGLEKKKKKTLIFAESSPYNTGQDNPFTIEGNEVKQYLKNLSPDEEVQVYDIYNDEEKMRELLANSDENTRLAFFAHHGSNLFGSPAENLGDMLQNTTYANCYLGSCYSGDIADKPQFKNLQNFHFRPGYSYPYYDGLTEPGRTWQGFNPKTKTNAVGENAVNEAMFNTTTDPMYFKIEKDINNLYDQKITLYKKYYQNGKRNSEIEKDPNYIKQKATLDKLITDSQLKLDKLRTIVRTPVKGVDYDILNPISRAHKASGVKYITKNEKEKARREKELAQTAADQNTKVTNWLRGRFKDGGKITPEQQKQGGVVKDNRGYWNPNNWGKVVEIDSPDITMEGVDQDLIGISDEGDVQYMTPGKDYKFKGKKVREYPVGKNGVNQQDEKVYKQLDQLTNFTNYNKPTKGGWLDKYN